MNPHSNHLEPIKLNLKMDTEAMRQIERIGRVEGYIQSQLSTPFARSSLQSS